MVDMVNKISINYITTDPEWTFRQRGPSKNVNARDH